MDISDEAVEAAARSLDPQTMGSAGGLAEKFKDQTRAEARAALEAAVPYLAEQGSVETFYQVVWNQEVVRGFPRGEPTIEERSIDYDDDDEGLKAAIQWRGQRLADAPDCEARVRHVTQTVIYTPIETAPPSEAS